MALNYREPIGADISDLIREPAIPSAGARIRLVKDKPCYFNTELQFMAHRFASNRYICNCGERAVMPPDKKPYSHIYRNVRKKK